MSAVLNPTPRPILQGTRDDSGAVLPVIGEQLPSHLPHVFLFAEEGVGPEIVSGSDINKAFGAKTLNLRSKYATHQTALATIIAGRANAMVIQRLRPADAKDPATITLAVEIVEDDIPVFERETDGTYKYDQQGQPVPTGQTVAGHRIRWVIGSSQTNEIGVATRRAGELTGKSGLTQSTIYPIGDLQVSSFGEHGNHKGLRLWANTLNSPSEQPSDEVIDSENAYLYRLQFIKRADAKSQPVIVTTTGGSQSIEFSFKPGAMNRKTDSQLYLGDILLDSYRNLDVRPRQYGPFNGLHLYEDNIAEVHAMLYAAEQPNHLDWPEDVDAGKYLINIVNGLDISGAPYHTIQVLGNADGGAELTKSSNYYAAGGSDGTMTFETFDELVAHELANYGQLDNHFLDTASWPQSHYYDSGFTLPTKLKMISLVGLRKDVQVTVATQDVSQPQNTSEQETSIAIALRAAARLYPESEVFGTPVCRVTIVGHSGYLINSQYKGLLPLTVDLADKRAYFMGAANGIWNRDRGYDQAPYNQVTLFKDVNNTYKPSPAYDKDWQNGLVWVQKFNTTKLFYPAIQTVYDDATSVLNSDINAAVIVEAEKVCERVWRQLVGGSKLTQEQFLEKSDQLIAEETDGRFDDRFIIVPRTYFTGYDAILGYSWSTDIEIYMNKMVLVGTYTIVARDRATFGA